jgi:uncharacterized membrane protein (UPF0182 family)
MDVYQQSQEIRLYAEFDEVDVDRYQFDGMCAPDNYRRVLAYHFPKNR